MDKDDLVKAIAKAKEIAYDESTKDLNAIHAVKQDIRQLEESRRQRLLASSADRKSLKGSEKGQIAQTA